MVNIFKEMGMKEIVENGQRLNNYLKSVDEDLKALVSTFNDNTIKIQKRLEQLDTRIAELVQQQQKKN